MCHEWNSVVVATTQHSQSSLKLAEHHNAIVHTNVAANVIHALPLFAVLNSLTHLLVQTLPTTCCLFYGAYQVYVYLSFSMWEYARVFVYACVAVVDASCFRDFHNLCFVFIILLLFWGGSVNIWLVFVSAASYCVCPSAQTKHLKSAGFVFRFPGFSSVFGGGFVMVLCFGKWNNEFKLNSNLKRRICLIKRIS